MLNIALVYKCRTKSFCYTAHKPISYEKIRKKGGWNETGVVLKSWMFWDRCISDNAIIAFRMHHKPAKFIVSSHVAEFIISGVKSTDIMKLNWLYKAGYVPWGHFKYSHTEKQ